MLLTHLTIETASGSLLTFEYHADDYAPYWVVERRNGELLQIIATDSAKRTYQHAQCLRRSALRNARNLFTTQGSK